MILTHYGRQVVLKQDVRLDSVDCHRWFERQRKIDTTAAEHFHQLGHGAVKYVELDARILPSEGKQRLREDRGKGICDTYIEGSGIDVVDVGYTVHAHLGALDSLAGVGEHLASGFRKGYAVA